MVAFPTGDAGDDDGEDAEADVFRELTAAVEACHAAAPGPFAKIEAWVLFLMLTVEEQGREARGLRRRIGELESRGGGRGGDGSK